MKYMQFLWYSKDMKKQSSGSVAAVVGGQWGDEGKGKLVDILSGRYDVIVRATGGANAGHTIYRETRGGSEKFVFHLIPAGMFHKNCVCVMGNGMVVHLPTLVEEMEALQKAGVKIAGRLFLSDRAHLTFEYHKKIDALQEQLKGASKVGTTGRGIGPTYADKISRIGIRAGALLDFAGLAAQYKENLVVFKKMYGLSHDGDEELAALKKLLPRIAPLVVDTTELIAKKRAAKKAILIEGANGTLLDIDHGTFPFVTSSNASIGGIVSGSGVAPVHIKEFIGIMKAYMTRVGSGPFPTELNNELGEEIRKIGNEFGATTGRPRRTGWFDAVASRYSVMLNGMTSINLTKLDVLSSLPRLKIATGYSYGGKKLAGFPADAAVLGNIDVTYRDLPGWKSDISKVRSFRALPTACKKYVEMIEKLIGCRIGYIGVGLGAKEMIYR